MLRHEATAADLEFRVAIGGENAFDEVHSRPHTAGVLPTASGATQPLAENRARESKAPSGTLQRAGRRGGLASGPHTNADQRREKIGGDSETRALGDVVDVADDLQPAARSDDAREQFGEVLTGAFDARRHDAGG